MNMNSEKPVKTAVIGHPVAHSKSPLIHGYWRDLYKVLGTYETIDIAPENLKRDVQDLIDQGYAGFNVTVPHKVSIIELCEEIDQRAKIIGAVNTVTIIDGKLYGSNTDAYGFTENIKKTAKHCGYSWSFNEGKAVVLGAGGAARAIIYALLREDVPEIIITNRTIEKAQELQQMAPEKILVAPWEERNEAFENANMIINATSLGMVGKAPLEVDLSYGSSNALVTDIVYAPLHTDLLEQAKRENMRIVTGIGMLLHQAKPGFELWNGVAPEVTPELEEVVLR